MLRREFVVQMVRRGVLVGAAAGLSGCGTLFHQERLGQPHSRRIDWCVAAADGLGLLLFFIPGVIAFVVDFSTGAIYLPCDYYSSTGGEATPAAKDAIATSGGVEFARIYQTRDRLDPRSIEESVSMRVGRPVGLVDSEARVSELAALDQFATQRTRHDRERGFGRAIKDLLTWRSAAA